MEGGGAGVASIAWVAVSTTAAGGSSLAKMALMAGITALAQSVAAEDTCAFPVIPIVSATRSPKFFNISSLTGLFSVTRNRYRS